MVSHLVELIVVVMMIGILSSIAIPQFMTSADKAKQKEATGIVSALLKQLLLIKLNMEVLPSTALQLSEYAKFQECFADGAATDGGAACRAKTVVVRAPQTKLQISSLLLR